MSMRRYRVTITTASDGSATSYTTRTSGRVHQLEYVKPTSGGYDDGVDFTITGEATGVNLWTESNVNASAVRAPRQPVHSQAGAALVYGGASGSAVEDLIALATDRVKIVLASGGNAKTGVFHVLVDE